MIGIGAFGGRADVHAPGLAALVGRFVKLGMREWLRRIRLLAFILLQLGALPAEPIPVRYREGTNHGFLAVRTLEGKILAAGDLTQTVRKNVVVSRLVSASGTARSMMRPRLFPRSVPFGSSATIMFRRARHSLIQLMFRFMPLPGR